METSPARRDNVSKRKLDIQVTSCIRTVAFQPFGSRFRTKKKKGKKNSTTERNMMSDVTQRAPFVGDVRGDAFFNRLIASQLPTSL